MEKVGKLYLVATPIGNLEDITLRALRVLKEVDLIACEDTRHTRKLLTHFDIHKPLVSYHEHNEKARAEELIRELTAGKNIALVSDAGTPGISDPGYDVVSAAIAAAVRVIPVPGASALIVSLIGSGLPTNEFHFVGFLPSKSSARKEKLESLTTVTTTLIFYEAPHRLKAMLQDLLGTLGNRHAVVARELTKLHEEFRRDNLTNLIETLDEHSTRGEFVIIVEGATGTLPQEQGTIVEQVQSLMELSGLTKMEAIKQVARSRGLSKNEVYQQVIPKTDEHSKY
ncbi:MAG TPA: 16S rRNA (cytidine(1402)-2'-O)-methyltransferase [Blastocatellia bacterium]|nr:16S rRNA (cytidine(1402)-2'-O)-methyltransferase [Blastocatellia bacterium]